MKPYKVMTFAEFKEKWHLPGSSLIAPADLMTHDQNELGIIVNDEWRPIVFTDTAKEVIQDLLEVSSNVNKLHSN
jgi:hypothetical protein